MNSVQPPPSAPKKSPFAFMRNRQFLFYSIVFHLLLAVVATVLVVQTFSGKRKLTFQGGPPTINPNTRALEHQVQMTKKQKTMSAPAQAKRITTTAISKVALPEMPDLPKTDEIIPGKMAGMGGTGLGLGPAGSMGGGTGGGFGGSMPMFGLRNAAAGGTLVGTLYDFKQTKAGKPTGLSPWQFGQELKKYIDTGSEAMFNDYFKSPEPLYLSQFYIPQIKADEGPKAFKVEDKVQPTMWAVLYKGKVIPPESGKFRFVGIGDDYMVVRFNGRVVLNCGASTNQDSAPEKAYLTEGVDLENGMGWYKGSGVGNTMEVQAGHSYSMEVLIAEQPGGHFMAWLMLEKEGAEYKTDKKGSPILPIFKLLKTSSPKMNPEDVIPIFARDQPWSVWSAEKKN